MARFGLTPITLLTLIATAVLLPAAGWFSDRSPGRAAMAAEFRKSASPEELNSDAAWRYRSGRPHHWRYLVMRR